MALISADDFNNLLTDLAAQITNRGSSVTKSVTVGAHSPIDPSCYDSTLISKQSLLSYSDLPITDESTYNITTGSKVLKNFYDALGQIRDDFKYNHKCSGCMGICSSCTGSCNTSCSNSCGSSCSSACRGCSGACSSSGSTSSSGCSSGCWASCDSRCGNSCSENCGVASCSGTGSGCRYNCNSGATCNGGAYGGCVGSIGFDGSLNQAITIRTFVSRNNELWFQAGGGIVAKSNVEYELQEVNNKLGALRKAIEIAEKL